MSTTTPRPVRFLAFLSAAALVFCAGVVQAQSLPPTVIQVAAAPPGGEEPAPAVNPEAAPDSMIEGTEMPPTIGIGVGMAVLLFPEDSDFKGKSSPLDLFLDWDSPLAWLKIRAGYNTGLRSEAELSPNVKATLTTTSLYGALRFVHDLTPRLRAVLLGGLAQVNSVLESSTGSISQGDSGLGILAGAGVLYRLRAWGIGAQAVVLSREGNFEGVKVYTGSNQVQAIAVFNF